MAHFGHGAWRAQAEAGKEASSAEVPEAAAQVQQTSPKLSLSGRTFL